MTRQTDDEAPRTAPHLALIHEGPIDPDLLEEFRSTVAAEGLKLEIRGETSIRAGAWPWLAPTTVMLWISKSYADGLLKDHVVAVEEALRRLGQRLSGLKYLKASAKTSAKIEDRYSPILSVWTDRREGGRMKMLVPAGFENEALDTALSAYMTFVQAYHTGALDPEDLAILTEARPVGGITLLAYDLESATIQLVDPLDARLPPP